MGKCKDCKWWNNPNYLSSVGWCMFGKICEEILAPMDRFLVTEDFGCIHFPEEGEVTKEEIKRHLAKIIYDEDPEEYRNIEQVLDMDWEELLDKLIHTIQDAHEGYSI